MGSALPSSPTETAKFGLIYVMNADGSKVERLMDTSPGNAGQFVAFPLWSPDGTTIAFSAGDRRFYSVYVMHPDGSDVKLVTEGNLDRVQAGHRTASGSRSFWVNRTSTLGRKCGRYRFHALTASGHLRGPITWSPDSTRLVFDEAHDPQGGECRRVRLTNLTASSAIEATPSFSPDGTHIAFVSDRDLPNGEIYVMNPDGSGVVRLTENLARDTARVGPPDGSQIAFISDRDGTKDIYVMNADGTARRASRPTSR